MSTESVTGLACGDITRSSIDRIGDAISAEKNECSGGRSGPELVTAPANVVTISPWSSRTIASRRWTGSMAAAPLRPAFIRARKIMRLDLSENCSNTSPPHKPRVLVSLRPRTGEAVRVVDVTSRYHSLTDEWDQLSRKFATNFFPSFVSTLSGWNCTPSTGNFRCRRPIMTRVPSLSEVQAETSKSLGRPSSATINEW